MYNSKVQTQENQNYLKFGFFKWVLNFGLHRLFWYYFHVLAKLFLLDPVILLRRYVSIIHPLTLSARSFITISLSPSLFPFSREEVEKENYDPVRYYTAAALTTVVTRIFGVRSALHAIDRCPTFVNKEKSFRTKFIKYSRKVRRPIN